MTTLPASYAACRAITRRANSSFPLAFRLLPAARRRAMDALYAFFRVTDDLADAPADPAAKAAALAGWRAALRDALAGRPTHPAHPALADVVHKYTVPPGYLFDVIDGAESDLTPVRFGTFADLYPYCYRVASAVGLACVRVWGVRPGAAFADADGPAEAAGIAFQLTNILRDVGEDAAAGRVYLPADELERFGCREAVHRPGGLCRQQPPGGLCHDDGLADLLRFQAARAREYYRRGAALDRLLTDPGRAIFRVMSGTYRALLDEVERRGPAGLAGRARVGRLRKLGIFLGAWPVRWGIL